MALDSFFRAEDPATLRTVVRSQAFRNIIGDVRDPDGAGFIQIPGSVDWVYFKPNRVVITPAVFDGNGDIITPAVTDPWCWWQVRLTGTAETNDAEGDPTEGTDPQPDRWRKSKLKRWMKENGTPAFLDQAPEWSGVPNAHIRGYMFTLGNGKRIGILRGSEMRAAGPPAHFHEYLGGNAY